MKRILAMEYIEYLVNRINKGIMMIKQKNVNVLFVLAISFLLMLNVSCKDSGEKKSVDSGMTLDKKEIASEMKQVLNRMLEVWYPLSLDTLYGGYYSDLDNSWKLTGPQNKMIVTQSRHVWSVSNLILNFPEYSEYKYVADHGYEYLKEVMWDKEFGGFYDTVTREGEVLKQNDEIYKNAYGNAFAIFALSAYYNLTGNSEALKLAQDAFYWMDKNSYDPVHGGYFQFLKRNGEPIRQSVGGIPPKDYNSSLHILEYLTELYKVWPDELVKKRLTDMIYFTRDVLADERGFLKLYFTEELNHITFRDSAREVAESNYYIDHITFGHDVEAAYLLLEASEVLGIHGDESTLMITKRLVDHSLRFGIDKEKGGIFDVGCYFENEPYVTIVKNTKAWWAQVEAFNTFLIMSDMYPNNDHDYFNTFTLQWDYCKKYLIDDENGDWYWTGIDVAPESINYPKGTIWKVNYHTTRSLINCMKRLTGT